MVYMGDFNAQHPDLCDLSDSHNRNGVRLLSYLQRHCLTRWDTGGATHSRGSYPDIWLDGVSRPLLLCASFIL